MPCNPTHVLILGGTADAVTLAERLAAVPRLSVTTSLVGLTRWSTPIPGTVLRGGLGGVEGLARLLRERRVDRLVDATHPFAAIIGGHAVAAAARAGVPLIRLERPAWQSQPGDRWLRVADTPAAAAALAAALGDRPAVVFLTIGRRGLDAFSALGGVHFIIRMVEPPTSPPPLTRHTLVLDRGPFTLAGEASLMAHYGVGWLVAKNSGGDAVAAKLEAARRAGIRVVMIERPTRPAAGHGPPTVGDVDAVLDWLAQAPPLAPPESPP